MKLILVRHGETPGNVAGVLDTAPPGPGLTERGALQAAALVDRFSGDQIDAIYASTLTRTQLTAQPLAAERGLPLTILSELREFSVGDLEGRSDPEALAEFVAVMRRWLAGDLSAAMPGGETGAQIVARMDAAITAIAQAAEDAGNETVLAVSHGGAIRIWAAATADNISAEFAQANYLVNTAVIVMTGGPGSWHCQSWDLAPPHGHGLSWSVPSKP